jgi:hypothetical protein
MEKTSTLLKAEIIFTEVYFYIHGRACEKDVWPAALALWKSTPENMPMVAMAISAAESIETGTVRRVTEH